MKKKLISREDVLEAMAKAWVDIAHENKENKSEFMLMAVTLGADIANRVAKDLFGKDDE